MRAITTCVAGVHIAVHSGSARTIILFRPVPAKEADQADIPNTRRIPRTGKMSSADGGGLFCNRLAATAAMLLISREPSIRTITVGPAVM